MHISDDTQVNDTSLQAQALNRYVVPCCHATAKKLLTLVSALMVGGYCCKIMLRELSFGRLCDWTVEDVVLWSLTTTLSPEAGMRQPVVACQELADRLDTL